MMTVFILNPKAGKNNDIQLLSEKIKAAASKVNREVEIYITKAKGDAERFVKEMCKENPQTRFIACGGDGTLCEVLNGVYGFNDAKIGVFPCGTGNDFCRNFETACFTNPEKLITADTVKCDVIKYTTTVDAKVKSGLCINMFNIGFDCNVADLMGKIKEKTILQGSLAYFASIFAILIKKKGADLEIECDGQKCYDGKLLLTSVANGCFCGGGIKSNPDACVSDGRMDINIIKNVTRINFLSKLPYYMKGTHKTAKGIEKILINKSCNNMTVTPKNGKMRLCCDGEIFDAGKTNFTVLHNFVNFVLPKENEDKGACCEHLSKSQVFSDLTQ